MAKTENMGFIGIILMAFISIIVALALFNGGITSNVAGTTTLGTTVNDTVTSAASGSAISLDGKYVSDLIATNISSGATIPSTNYTIQNNQVVNGVLTARLLSNDGTEYPGQSWNVSYTYQPEGYITSSGGRSIASIIIVLTALAIASIGLILVGKSKIQEIVGK